MLTLKEKISYLEQILNKIDGSFTDEIKSDLIIFFDAFVIENEQLQFLNCLNSFEEIDNWMEKLTSRIIMKFDSESEQINDFIYDFIELG